MNPAVLDDELLSLAHRIIVAVAGSVDIADAFAAAKKRREERKAKEQQSGEDE